MSIPSSFRLTQMWATIRKIVTAVERASADHGESGAPGVGVVDAGETDRTAPLADVRSPSGEVSSKSAGSPVTSS